MSKDFNPIMKDSILKFFGTVFVNGMARGVNKVSFHFSLAYILSDLGSERIESKRTNGYIHYKHHWGNKTYDFTDHKQFLEFRDIVKKAYKEEEEFWRKRKQRKHRNKAS